MYLFGIHLWSVGCTDSMTLPKSFVVFTLFICLQPGRHPTFKSLLCSSFIHCGVFVPNWHGTSAVFKISRELCIYLCELSKTTLSNLEMCNSLFTHCTQLIHQPLYFNQLCMTWVLSKTVNIVLYLWVSLSYQSVLTVFDQCKPIH